MSKNSSYYSANLGDVTEVTREDKELDGTPETHGASTNVRGLWIGVFAGSLFAKVNKPKTVTNEKNITRDGLLEGALVTLTVLSSLGIRFDNADLRRVLAAIHKQMDKYPT